MTCWVQRNFWQWRFGVAEAALRRRALPAFEVGGTPERSAATDRRETLRKRPHEIRRRNQDQGTAVHWRGKSREPARWSRGLCLWRKREGGKHASRLPKCGTLNRAPLRRAARRKDQTGPDDADRYRLRRLYPQIFPRRALTRRARRTARCDRALGAHVLRLDGALAGLQGVADEYARRQFQLLRQVRRQCEGLVPARAGKRPVHESRHRQSAGRSLQAGR